MGIFLPQRWRQQPSYGVEIDWSNKLTKRILHASTPYNYQVDGVTRWKFGATGAKRTNVRGYLGWMMSSYIGQSVGTGAGAGSGGLPASDQTILWIVSAEYDTMPATFPAHRGPYGGDYSGNAFGLTSTGTFAFISNSGNTDTAVPIPLRKFNIVVLTSASTGSPATKLFVNNSQVWTSTTYFNFDNGYYRVINRFGVDAPTTQSSYNGLTGYPVFHYACAQWARALSDAEVYDLSTNPWQIFRPATRYPYIGGSSVIYSYSRPSSDITTQWLPSTPGAPHYSMINETAYNDSDYIYATAASQTDEVGLQPMAVPQTGTSLSVNYRLQGMPGNTSVTVSLYSGATLIKTDTVRTADSTPIYTMVVSAAEWASVTDWTNLRLRFVSG